MDFDLVAIWCLGVGVVWLAFNLAVTWFQRYVLPLSSITEGLDEADTTPSVTVVVPARNERDRIEESVRRLLAQRAVDLELVVVDDRSDDGTTEILRRLDGEDPRLRVMRIDELPVGWLGKPYACHLGAINARGDWILFTDADIWMNPDLIADSIRAAEAERSDLVCLLPAQKRITLWGRAALLTFSMALAITAGRANSDSRLAPVGIGAYNLVRATAYRRVGGYEALRMEVIDDMKLGLLLMHNGSRLRCWTAADEAEMDWAATPRELVRALDKNFIALAELNFGAATLGIVITLAAWITAWVGPFSNGWTGYAAFGGMVSMILPGALFARHSKWGLLPAFLTPLIFPLLPWSLLRSAWLTWRQGGIRWRETVYPLELLRKHRVSLFLKPRRH
ncbi:MAG: glycosyltransferase [Acidobacteria bacterium]|nr:glycosyltransferase [Acidobacteriota bacterium]NIM62761.1 glycosyltransferase [Acidobacteriota bacterium]NIO59061.1 glycosyltransferase [Acidobacteriota bacterium]NIQ30100.1 glycosyltransferase [Acidobacteriota bacterium]NIQ84903.1 glycosyltransferase [Acidobacteriota bacterium]